MDDKAVKQPQNNVDADKYTTIDLEGTISFIGIKRVWERGRQGDRVTGKQGNRETGKQGDRETGCQGVYPCFLLSAITLHSTRHCSQHCSILGLPQAVHAAI